MDPRLLEILKKAKQIDKAAEKFDNGAVKKSKTAGLSSQMMDDGDSSYGITESIKKDVGSENYNQAVKSSKLPAAIQRAMLENPIPQAGGDFDVDEDTIKQLRGESRSSVPSYSEEDEVDFYEKPAPRKKVIREERVSSSSVNVDENYLRKLIASELTKALPKVIEHYFDSRLVKENVQFKAGSTIFSGTVMPMPKVKGKNNI